MEAPEWVRLRCVATIHYAAGATDQGGRSALGKCRSQRDQQYYSGELARLFFWAEHPFVFSAHASTGMPCCVHAL